MTLNDSTGMALFLGFIDQYYQGSGRFPKLMHSWVTDGQGQYVVTAVAVPLAIGGI